MSISITIRNVPTEVRDELAARASRSGKSLQEYLRQHLIDTASRPEPGEVIDRARQRVHRTGSELSAEAILRHQDSDRR